MLFRPDFVHVESPCVSTCGRDPANRVRREERPDDDPEVHYGTIASANTVMKDARRRDLLAAEWKILCFEMEAAGLMNRFPCLVIRGICDYSDSHKSKEWQGYAAMVAAAYAQSLLDTLSPESAMSERTLQSILENVAETKHAVAKIGSQQHTEKELKILGWLSDTNMAAEQDNAFAQRQRDTGKWFLNSDQYRNWVEGHGQILFCPGIPGAGKTILSSIVIDDLKTKFDSQLDIGLAYFYCKFNNKHKQTIGSLQASLLKQLCQRQPHLPNNILSLFEKHEKDGTAAQDREIAEALQLALETYPRVFIVIDALDEWQNTEADRSSMVEAILSLREKFSLNLLATARPLKDIREKFPWSPSLKITAAEEDITLYIDDHLGGLEQVLSKPPRGLQVKDEMKRSLCTASKGMFLIAQLHLKALITQPSVRKLEDALKKLLARTENKEYAEILKGAYDATMDRIRAQDHNSKELALEVLSWISLATSELRAVELQHAVAFQYGDTKFDEDGIVDVGRMTSVCCGLAEVDRAGRRIRLVHYTTQVYFRDHPVQWPPDVQSNLTKKGVGYLSLCGLEDGTCQVHEKTARWNKQWLQHMSGIIRHWSSKHPLYKYATTNWGHHARNVSKVLNDTTNEIMLDFLRNGRNVQLAAEVMFGREGVNGLHLAAHFGLDELLLRLLEDHAITAQDSRGRTALSWAARAGHESTVVVIIDKLLACQGVDLNEQDSIFGETPLFLAAFNGHTAVVELLLQRGANTEVRNYKGWTPAAQAAWGGHCAVVDRLLLEKGSQKQQVSYAQQQGLLSLAAGEGQAEVVLLLLNKGVDVNSRNKTGRTALANATSSKEYDVVKLLLDGGADIDLLTLDGNSPLSLETEMDRALVRLFLDRGADIHFWNAGCDTALHRAIYKEDQDLVKQLVDAGANINVQGLFGYSPLMDAITRKQEDLSIMFVKRGAALDLVNQAGHTAFDLAYRYGLKRVGKLLKERGAPSRVWYLVLNNEGACKRWLERAN